MSAENRGANLRTPRLVKCSACGRTEPLRFDQPGVVVELPRGWRRLDRRLILCVECYRAELREWMRNAS